MSNNDKPVILSACRTAGGKYGGAFKSVAAPDLGAAVLAEAVKRSAVEPEKVEELVMGNGWQSGVGANPARMAGWRSGLLKHAPAFTVNKRCGSGLQSVMLTADRIRLGDINAGAAGGMESASNVPYILPDARWGQRMGDGRLQDILHRDGFLCPLAEMMMGKTAEILADEYRISREEQDEFALRSHMNATAAADGGKFDKEIVPVTVKSRKSEDIIKADEIPRRETSIEKLGRLPALFAAGGSVTAGNSSALCDGASALVLSSGSFAASEGVTPMAEIVAYASSTVEPDHMGMGPVGAVNKALKTAGLTLDDIDLIELNEAFAVQVLAVQKELPFKLERCNIYGGAISLGHPIGATGAKILTTLVHALGTERKELGLATACIGGGQAVAMIIRRLN